MNRLNILVYCGEGVSRESLQHTVKSLRGSLLNMFDVKTVTINEFREPWEASCAMIVISGGRDIPYTIAFDQDILVRIRNYVQNGGSYFGICAGAYFASDFIEFEKGRQGYEVIAKRELSLFNGIAKGSVFPNFEYSSEKGAVAANILTCVNGLESLHCYSNGGCMFEQYDTENSATILGKYEANGMPAVIGLKYGNGKVLLSGVHPEYNPSFISQDTPSGVLCTLIQDKEKIGTYWDHLLSYILGISIEYKVDNADMPIKCVHGLLNTYEIDPLIYNTYFDSSKYSNSLETKIFGQTLLFTPKIESTQSYLQDNMLKSGGVNGLTLLASVQTKGRGRGNNSWISPPPKANLQFSFLLNDPEVSNLSIIQCVVSVAMVLAARKILSTKSVFIKWPNDIYICDQNNTPRKIGGILVNSIISNNSINLLIGCGLNIGPCAAGVYSLSDVANIDDNFVCEKILAEFFNEFERQYENLEHMKERVIQIYLNLWLHQNQRVYIEKEGIWSIVRGIDEFGYILAENCESSEITALQPDGNSFDMMANLIKVKNY